MVARPNVATLTTLLLVSAVAGIGLYDDWQKISKKASEGLSVRYKFLLLTLAVVLADVLALRYVGVTQTIVVPGFDRNVCARPRGRGDRALQRLLAARDRRDDQRRQPDGRARRARGGGGGHSAVGLYGHSLPRAPVRCRDHLRGDGRGRSSGSSGTTRTRPTCSWATRVPWQSAACSAAAVLTKTEMLLPMIGGLFVVEAFVGDRPVRRLRASGRRRRVFKMAPIHHHFEMMGWEENKVVVRFWIAQAAFSALGFFLYYIFLYSAVA